MSILKQDDIDRFEYSEFLRSSDVEWTVRINGVRRSYQLTAEERVEVRCRSESKIDRSEILCHGRLNCD